MVLTVLRPANGVDCTNGGISSHVTKVTVVGAEIPTIFAPTDDCPAMVIDERLGYKFLRPVDDCPADLCGYMFGGNFAYTSDSRWSHGALPIHDRTETAALNARLSI